MPSPFRSEALLATLLAASFVACGAPSRPESAADPELDEPAGASASGPGSGGKASPPSKSPDVSKGIAQFDAGDFAGAKASFEAAVAKDPKDADALYYAGLASEKLGDRAGAESKYKGSLALRPDFEAAAVNASALASEAKRFDDALAYLDAARKKHPGNASLALNQGVAFAEKGDAAAATRAFEDAAKAGADDPMVHLTVAHWQKTWNKRDRALEALKKADALAKGDVGLLAAVGDEYRGLGAFAECTSAFDRAIAKRDVAELRTERALCKLGAKDDSGALADLQAAVTKEPNYAPAHFYIGGRFAAQGKWKETADAYATYLRLAPSGPMAKVAEERAALAKKKLTGGKTKSP